MLQRLRKRKVYTKLSPDTVNTAHVSFQIKIYLWSLADYQHLQKYFITGTWHWTITSAVKSTHTTVSLNRKGLLFLG